MQTLYNVSGNAPMLGIVVAMETFCGQAYGAKRYPTVGVVLQVSTGCGARGYVPVALCHERREAGSLQSSVQGEVLPHGRRCAAGECKV